MRKISICQKRGFWSGTFFPAEDDDDDNNGGKGGAWQQVFRDIFCAFFFSAVAFMGGKEKNLRRGKCGIKKKEAKFASSPSQFLLPGRL